MQCRGKHGKKRIPGVEYNDPFSQKKDALFRFFVTNVMENNALNKQWLLRHVQQ
jgi:hypothetical protein